MKFFLLFSFLLLFSCNNSEEVKISDDEVALFSNANQQLVFKIDQNDKISGELKIKSLNDNREHKTILPFQTKDVKDVRKILSSSANYNSFTLLAYSNLVNSGTNSINFQPIINIPNSQNSTIEELNDGIYLLKSGLERKFIYNNHLKFQTFDEFKNSSFDSVNFVAVKLPLLSNGIEVVDGKTSVPEPFKQQGKVKYFKLSKNDKYIKIGYVLPPNAKQLYIVELGKKFLSVLGIFAIEFIFFKKNKKIKPKAKKNISVFLIFVNIAIIVWLSYVTYTSDSISFENIGDYVVLLFGLALTFVLAYIKSEEEKPEEN